VPGHIDRWLDVTAPSPGTVVSACAGDGRDLLVLLCGIFGHISDTDWRRLSTFVR
jgi:hypothetical protein